MIARLTLVLALLASPAFAEKLEPNTNRGGGDFRDFTVGSPEDCRDACKADAACRAFTYVKPGVQGPQARCWLKSTVPEATKDPNCTSGVIARAAPKAGDLEYGTNRAGKDYKDFAVSSGKPDDCRAACNADVACKSFTFVKPGVQGAEARCWLKNEVPPATPDANCVSGIAVRAPSGGCPCVATTCAAACKDAIVLLCVAGGTTKNDGVACQKCIDSKCPN